jgi:4-carboxymuconolactone decarboxylase
MPAKKTPAKTFRKPAAKAAAKSSAKAVKIGPIRLPAIAESSLTDEQRALMSAIASGPRGSFKMGGPFFCYLHSPAFGELAQKLGAHLRFGTSIPPRLSEFAILTTARQWRAQYEWAAHEPQADKAGVKRKTIEDLRVGRAPTSAPRDEKALYAFIKELYRNGRASDRTYKAVHAVLGHAGMVELVGLLGYYTMVALTLNTFRMPVPDGAALPFKEPTIR